MTEQPKKLLILGCGPIGCELGQTFARLGTKVVMSEVGSHFLPRDDAECVAYLRDSMLKDGVKMLFQTKPKMFKKLDNGRIKATLKNKNDEIVVQEFDAVLLAVGRVPNVSGLGLEAAGV